jgi:hypothetical protein
MKVLLKKGLSAIPVRHLRDTGAMAVRMPVVSVER